AVSYVASTQPASEMTIIPAIAVRMISQPPAYVGLPPIRTMRRSTGRMTGSVNERSMRPRALKGEIRRERSNHDPSATRAVTTTSPKTAYRTTGIGQLRAIGRGDDPLLLDLVRG